MRKYIILSLAASALIVGGSLVSNPAFAEDKPVPTATVPALPVTPSTEIEHKKINEVEKRIEKQEVKDEQKELNKELNKNHKIDAKQKHHNRKEMHEHKKEEMKDHKETGAVAPVTK